MGHTSFLLSFNVFSSALAERHETVFFFYMGPDLKMFWKPSLYEILSSKTLQQRSVPCGSMCNTTVVIQADDE